MNSSLTLESKRKISDLKKALCKDPNNPELLTRLGALYFVVFYEDPSDMVNLLEKAITIDSKNDEAMFWLAKYFYHYAIDLNKTKKYLENALQINPDRADCFNLLASVVYDKFNDLDLQISYLEKATNYARDWYVPRIMLAKCLLKKGDFTKAKKIAEIGYKFSKSYSMREPDVIKYYNNVIVGNESEMSKKYFPHKEEWSKLLQSINEKIKEEK